RRAIGILNRTDASAQVKINWEKLGLKGTPKSLRDVWNGRNIESANVTVTVPPHDLALMVVEGEDKAPKKYAANRDSITGIQAPRGFIFARLHYANTSDHVIVVSVK